MKITNTSLDYVRDRYYEEQSRLLHVEEKCYKLVTILTLAIAAFGGAFSLKSSTLLTPTSNLEWVSLFVAGLCFIVLACAWGHALRALKMGEWPIAPRSRENTDYILYSDEDESKKHIFDCYVDATQAVDESIKEKIESLQHSYNEMTLSAFMIALFFILIAIMEIL